ncbi:TonB-dependent receptor domain-containing protein [Brevundimonas sp. PAMC22021]|uniref:TonB-dependent receptor domain-containing protein n=1 Tax=Brevundimonas sp. PAMC22021 TaxID=2861285 RepID=UPI001C62B34E|nr:TonB-dependent receptor [Brevundimonas sp. PAMC22021]QYF86970.1 TonB-dependent receptor [Brevundimonas sp. PAMC22021]
MSIQTLSAHSLVAAAAGLALCSTPSHAEELTSPVVQDRVSTVSDVVVTGRVSEQVLPVALPVQVLAGEELVHRRQSTLGETLAGLPGVHMDSFGGGASRPVIRGQTLPRIAILSDGAEVFDASSVSPDHAVATDPLLLDEIQVLRGPAATIYGGNAVYGAVNLIDSKVPKGLPQGGLTGATEARYGLGDEEKTIVGRVTAGIGAFALHVEGSRRDSNDYHVHSAYGSDELRDSFASGSSYSVGGSWITNKGYVGAAYTRMDSEYGLPGHSHLNGVCHTHGLDLHCEAHGGFDDPFGSPDSHTAYIKLRSDRTDLRADLNDLAPGLSQAKLRLSYTDYLHDEVDGDLVFTEYKNRVWDGRLELTHASVLGFVGTLGVQYTDATFSGINVDDLHVPFPEGAYGLDGMPDYVTRNAGVFLHERRAFGPVEIDLAVRKDWREIEVTVPTFRETMSQELRDLFAEWYGPDWRQIIEADEVDSFRTRNPGAEHDPFSASAAATWTVGQGYSAALSLNHSERAPNVRELYSRGNNLATNSYELGLAVGNPILDEEGIAAEDVLETTRAINLTFRKAGGPLEFEIGLFHQDVDDYVFARLIETETETGVPHNFLIYTAADVRFAGIDGQVSYQSSPEGRVTIFGDYVDADLKSENDELPRISPGRLGARYDWASGPVSWDVEYYRTFEQDRFASYETRTPGYDMLNATIAYSMDLGRGRSVQIYARGSNLTNDLAFSHTSFVKEQSPLRGRNIVFGVRHAF